MENTFFNVMDTFPQYEGEESNLLNTLKLAFAVLNHSKAEAFRIDKNKGLILYWTDKSEKREQINTFVTPLTAEQVYPQVKAFLESFYDGHIEVEIEDFDENIEEEDDELTSVEGWRVYTEKWGRIDGDTYAFLAIKPAYETYGK
ncbi:hypothetical protein JR311_20260 (plasmid) [Bacillus velezensis]|uniref:hypothetical protein n=1 Tax=Bacillus velezensis TaxID=492670 RepID=UPI0019591A3F|nr:hypothetical protein [Bacillus velezensis]QRV11361.1 hypothetical protein JR311_20260 [Bacillus velezensis]